MKRKPNSGIVELGPGGVKFEPHGPFMLATECNSTETQVAHSAAYLNDEFFRVAALVKQGIREPVRLQEQFKDTSLGKVASLDDWKCFAQDFAPENRDRGRPKSRSLTFLAEKMQLEPKTIKVYCSRERHKNQP